MMSKRHMLAPVLLLLCVVLGGASIGGYLGNFILQLVAVVVIILSLAGRQHAPIERPARRLLILLALAAALLLLQLVPLPPALWTMLPGREPLAQGFELLGLPLPWMPVSLVPWDGWAALAWMLPSIAMVLAVIRLGAFNASLVSWAFAVTAVLSVLLGALQVSGGLNSPWYIYQVTNRGLAVGFFANTNHLATFLLMTIPFLAALAARRLRNAKRKKEAAGTLVITAALVLVMLVGLLLSTSFAGVGLAVPVLLASLLIVVRPRGIGRRLTLLGLCGAVLAGAGALLWSPLGNTLGTASFVSSTAIRQQALAGTSSAIADYFPAGSGIGSFAQVYRTYEDPWELPRTYMNHAHSDYVELALEGGLPAILLALAFFLWWFGRVISIWREEKPDFIQQAATVASGAVLVHSVVDYPLRTAAIAGAFALCCALMSQARARTRRRSDKAEQADARHLSAD